MGAEQRSARNRFSALPIDRSQAFRERAAQGDPAFAVESVLRIAVSTDGAVWVEQREELRLAPADPAVAEHALETIYLGALSERPVVAYLLEPGSDAAPGAPARRWLDLRSAVQALPEIEAGCAAYARALAYWHQRYRYCGSCGALTRSASGGHRRQCTTCGLEQFPRIDPAIIVLVEHAGRCLLARQPGWPHKRYSVLAGFVEPGESLEDALIREVHEESGLTISECEYHSSQPWPFPSSLMLGFTARSDDPSLVLGEELEQAAWYSPVEMEAAVAADAIRLPPPVSLSSRLIEDWFEARTGRSARHLFR
jgi:NAD+ diphosphatase